MIERLPCAITLLPVVRTSSAFYDFDGDQRLVAATSSVDATTHLIVLLVGSGPSVWRDDRARMAR